MAEQPSGTEDTHRPEPQPSSSGPRPTQPLAEVNPGRYQIEGEFARGGLGRILKADDAQLGRTVAIKELLDKRTDWDIESLKAVQFDDTAWALLDRNEDFRASDNNRPPASLSAKCA